MQEWELKLALQWELELASKLELVLAWESELELVQRLVQRLAVRCWWVQELWERQKVVVLLGHWLAEALLGH